MIQTLGLTKSFGRRRAVDDVTVDFSAGSVTALLGLNGAGKTTLLRLIAGLDRPDRGRVTVCDRNTRDGLRRIGVHLGPEAMDPRHTVVRHLSWLAALSGTASPHLEDVLADTGLSEQRGDRIGRLSLGARQRLSIAATLLGDPPVLLFDEPLNGLDVPGIIWFRSLLRRLASEGRTVVIATHLLGEVTLTADHIAVLADGRLSTTGELAELAPAGTDTREWLETTVSECV